MKINYKDIKAKKPCEAGYLWFLETFGKEDVELKIIKEKASDGYKKWIESNFREIPTNSTDFYGIWAVRNESNDIIEFHLNGSVCKASKFKNCLEFPKGSFLPVENVLDTDRYVVIGIIESESWKNTIEYIYFYDTKFATVSNIFQLVMNIEKVYWAHINLGYPFFDIPLYAHFSDRFCKSENLETLRKYGKLRDYKALNS